ncbi:hypothetical protein NDU88_009438 [Pleurodeles waltl]|uniref:Uncharacterized protein n=1 Tax=Pleurodeles waltl TaxID=8319 RepID=A0AAV7P819_PLEWA|nr:hypothetical protein NDU88_009438 [Pleurodeles waltl]
MVLVWGAPGCVGSGAGRSGDGDAGPYDLGPWQTRRSGVEKAGAAGSAPLRRLVKLGNPSGRATLRLESKVSGGRWGVLEKQMLSPQIRGLRSADYRGVPLGEEYKMMGVLRSF